MKEIIYSTYDEAFEEDMPSLGEMFFKNMKIYGNKIAQIQGETGETTTYNQLLQQSIRVAQHMQSRGIGRKDIICLCSHNNLEIALPFIASQFLGALVCSLDPTLTTSDCKHLLNLVNPKFIFCDKACEEQMETALKDTNLKSEIVVIGSTEKYMQFEELLTPTGTEDSFEVAKVDIFDSAVIFFSSGTTGLPKGVCTHHYGLISQQRYMMRGHNTDIFLYTTTFYWISAVMIFIMSLLKGSIRVLCQKPDDKLIMEIIEKFKVTYCFLSPTLMKRIVKNIKINNYDTSSLESLAIGGERVYESQMATIRSLFQTSNIYVVYGQTEASGCLTFFTPKDKHLLKVKSVSSGKPIPGISYKIVDPDTNNVCGPNIPGQLLVKGKCLMVEYYNNPEETRNAWDEEGFLYTGDIVYYDEDKCFYIVDRIKELIKYQSWHVVPAEIETILLQHPAVKEAAVIGKPDNMDGEHPMGVVVPKPGYNANESDILNFVNKKLSERKQLRAGVIFVDKIPTTPTGKVKRRELRKSLLQS